MPPWPPDPTYRKFAHQRVLTAEQRNAIITWIDNGMPRGNPADEPPLPTFTNESQLPVAPQETLLTPTYRVTRGTDDYRCYVMRTQGQVTRFIRGMEMIPGNRAIVHHMLLYQDTTGTCRRLDAADPAPGYEGFGGPGTQAAELLGGWAPGTQPQLWPLPFGSRLRPGADLVLQVHYAPGSLGLADSTRVNLLYHAPGTVVREVYTAPILNHSTSLLNGPLTIPANQFKTFKSRVNVPFDITLLTIFPHAHLLCHDWKVYAHRQGADTVPLIRIPHWHFHWQGTYSFQQPVALRRGQSLEAITGYDNTDQNPYNPNVPPRTVNEGDATTDEMMLVYFGFAAYRPGDENLIMDSTLLTSNRPSKTATPWVAYTHNRHLMVKGLATKKLTLFSVEGKRVAGATGNTLPLGNLPTGMYILQAQAIDNLTHRRRVLVE